MNSADLERVKSAHAEALNLPPAERVDYLHAQFLNEPELREEAARLLECHDQAGQFLNTPLTSRLLGASATDLKIARIGPWELLRPLGTGGSATVYLARRADDLFEKQVAIKILNRLCHSEEVFLRFQREIRIIARVDHPYIVRLLEAGTTGEALAYLVTEFVDGTRIDEYAAPLPLDEKLRLFLKVCEAVSETHRNLIAHRDLKPSNILVTRDGTPKLLDFGIALLLDQDSRLTQTGLERMTLHYASPEQVRRDKDITTSTDIYSLGVILYELIAGRSPYGRPEQESASAILADDPLPLREAPRDLEAIVRKALRKAPAQRYESVRSLHDDISRFLEGLPVLARGDSAAYRAARLLRRQWHRIALVTAGAAFAFLISLLPQSSYFSPDRAVSISLESPEGRPLSLGFTPDGKRLYYLAGDVFFDYADLFVKDLGTSKVTQLTTDGVFKLSPAVSPDGRFAGFFRSASEQTSTLTILPAGGGAERKLFTGPSGEFTWGPNAKSVIVSYRSDSGIWPHLRGFEIDTGQWWHITAPPAEGRGDYSPSLSPDGKTLCFVRRESRESADLFALPVDANIRPMGTPRRLTSRRFRISSPQWTASGKEIVYAGGTLGEFRVFRVAADGRSEPHEITEAGGGVESVAVAPLGHHLALRRSTTQSNVWRLDLSGHAGRVVQKTMIETSADEGVFSPDGKRIAFLSAKSGDPQVWIANADGTSSRQVTSYPASDGLSALWLRDGSGLVTSVRSRAFGLRNFIVKLPAGNERELVDVKGTPRSFSSDGKWLYFSLIKKDIDIYRYSMDTGEIREVTRDVRGSYAVESPDGQTIYFSKPEAELGLWKVPANGGKAEQVLPNLARRSLFEVREEGIYYVERAPRSATIKLRQFSDGKDLELYRTSSIPYWGFSLSPDGRSILLGQQDVVTSEVRLFRDFR